MTSTTSTTWLVERAIRSDVSALEWEIVAGYGNAASARAHVRQCRAHSAKQGYALRAREDA